MALPTVTTSAATFIAQQGAIPNGNITATGGTNCDEVGFVWDTVSRADPGNTAPGSSVYASFRHQTGLNLGVVAFTFNSGSASGVVGSLGPLSLNTTYFYRGFAHNTSGYAYGSEQSFTSLATYPGLEGFAGAETGSISNGAHNWADGYVNTTNLALVSISSAHVYSGAYSYRLGGGAQLVEVGATIPTDVGDVGEVTLNSSRIYAVAHFYFETYTNASNSIMTMSPPSKSGMSTVGFDTSGNWRISCFGATGNNSTNLDILGNTHAVVTGQWYTLYYSYVDSTGQAELIVDDGVNQFTYHTTGYTGWSMAFVNCRNTITTGDVIYVDDICVHSDAYQNVKVIARQGSTSTPSSDTWTKNGGAAISDVWNDTPTSASSNASSTTANAVQTIPTRSFSVTQSGHGPETIGASGDTIVAAKLMGVMVAGSATTILMRTLVGGVTTDLSLGLNVTTVGRRSDNFVPSLANLNAMEGGIVKGNDAVSTQVNDVWFVAAYTPSTTNPPFTGTGLLLSAHTN